MKALSARPRKFKGVRRLRSGLLCLTLAAFLAVLSTSPGRAITNEEAIDFAVEGLAIGGHALGISLGPAEKALIKGVANCVADGLGELSECGRKILVKTVLQSVKDPAVHQYVEAALPCVMSGTPIATCGLDTVLTQVPDQVRPLLKCVAGGGEVAGCTQQFVLGKALDQTPPEVRPLMTCMILDGRAPSACAAEFALSKAPKDAQQAVQCLLDQKPVATCAAAQATKLLPKDAQPVANCIAAGGHPATCAANLLPPHPPVLRGFANCIGSGTPPDKCALEHGTKQVVGMLDEATEEATQKALKLLEDMKLDRRDIQRNELPGSLRGILMTAEGIRDGRIDLILEGAGPIVAKVTISIVLNVLLTPIFAPIIGPIVDAMIQNRVDAASAGWAAIKDGDLVKLGQVVFEFYAETFFESPCALVPDGPVKEATCGNLVKAVVVVSEFLADTTKDVLGLAKDILSEIGVYQVGEKVVNFVLDIGGEVVDFFFGGDDEAKDMARSAVCAVNTPAIFYQNNHLACLHRAVNGTGQNTASLTASCVKTFNQCSTNAAGVQDMCGAMTTKLNELASAMRGAINVAADQYMNGAGAFAASFRTRACWPDFWETEGGKLVDKCVTALGRDPKLSTRESGSCQIPQGTNAKWRACTAAFAKVDQNRLTGPTSDLCKSFVPCEPKAVATGKMVGDFANGNVIADITLHDGCSFIGRDALTHFVGMVIGAGPIKTSAGLLGVGAQTRPIPFQPFNPSRNPILEPALDPLERVRDSLVRVHTQVASVGPGIGMMPPANRATVPIFPPGGINMVPRNDPAVLSPPTRKPPIALPPGGRKPPLKPVETAKPFIGGPAGPSRATPPQQVTAPSGGGINLTRQPAKPSALDRLGDRITDNNLSSVGGNAGGPSIGRRPIVSPPAQAAKPAIDDKKSQGSGGINMTNSQSGNAPIDKPKTQGSGGINMTNSQSGNAPIDKPKSQGSGGTNMTNSQSGNAPLKPAAQAPTKPATQPAQPPKSSGPDSNFSYGACPGCGKKPKDDLIVR